MRIALNGRFYAAPVTGVQRFAREVFARLPARIPATLFLPASARPPEGVGLPPGVRGRLRGHAWEQLELPWRVRAAGCGALLSASGTAPLAGGPHVTVIHDLLPLTHPEWFGRRFALWYRVVVTRAARRAAAIITPSEWTRAEVVRLLGVPPHRIRKVTQGLEPFDAPAPAAEVERVRATLKLPDRYILAVGAGDRRKNMDFLLRMLGRWQSAHGNAPTLVIVGARPERVHGGTEHAAARSATDRVRRPGYVAETDHPGAVPAVDRVHRQTHVAATGHTAAVPAADRVRWLGYVADADLHALYTGARVFCFPSLAEGFGRPPLEAAACGTPGVVADYPAARELLGDAAVVLPLELDPWIDAVRALLEDTEYRAGRVARGAAIAAGYGWDAAADAVAEACLAAATKPRCRPVAATGAG